MHENRLWTAGGRTGVKKKERTNERKKTSRVGGAAAAAVTRLTVASVFGACVRIGLGA